MRELMSELGVSIVYLTMSAGFMALMTLFIDQVV